MKIRKSILLTSPLDQVDYPSNQGWQKTMEDPPKQMRQSMIAHIPNTRTQFLGDFSVLEIFPQQ